MSGGHWDYQGYRIREIMENIASDEDVKRRWPRITQLFISLAAVLWQVEHDMDYDLVGDRSIPNDKEFEDSVCLAVLKIAKGDMK